MLGALAALAAMPAAAQGRWVLVRPPLDLPRLNALTSDPGFLAASEDDKVAAVLPVAIEHGAPLSRWQRWLVYDSQASCEAGRVAGEANARQGLRELAGFVPGPDPLVQEAKQRAWVEGEVEVLLFQNARCVPEARAPR